MYPTIYTLACGILLLLIAIVPAVLMLLDRIIF